MAIDTARLLSAAQGRVAEGDQEVEGEPPPINVVDGIDVDALLQSAGAGGFGPVPGGITTEPEPDVGVVGAFGAGVEAGIKEPFRILGANPREVILDETSEKVANFLGSMVGLGISFVPFALGTGFALKGIGLAAGVAGAEATTVAIAAAAREKALFNFTRNTIAGSIQFAGTSEELAEVPGRAAAGAAFGAGIEAMFLARAMKGRRGAVGSGKLLNDGNPTPDSPVDIGTLAREVEISPSSAKSPSRLTIELNGLFRAEAKTYDQILVDLLEGNIEAVRLTGLDSATDIIKYARERFPNAQILQRGTSGPRDVGRRVFETRDGITLRINRPKGRSKEVLIHNPFDDADRLTKAQIAQWKKTGFAAGQEVIYAGKSYAATGARAVEGSVQLRDIANPSTVFAVALNVVSQPISARFFRVSAARQATIQQVVDDLGQRIGFNIAEGDGVLRGYVNISEFETAATFREFAESFTSAELKEAASIEEAVMAAARAKGIKGLVTQEEGIVSRVYVFDQSMISETSVVPGLGSPIDQSVRQGQDILSFTPSWRNAVSAPLIESGLPESEIRQLLDLYESSIQPKLAGLMDNEFQNIKRVSEAQFGGCA